MSSRPNENWWTTGGSRSTVREAPKSIEDQAPIFPLRSRGCLAVGCLPGRAGTVHNS